jgi:BA14K-like protein
MRKYRTIVLAAGLLLTAAEPVFAQAAIQEPGLFAFYHPNLDVLNGGAPTPEYFLEQRSRVKGSYFGMNRANASYCAQRYRSYDPATGTFISNNGRRHPCE